MSYSARSAILACLVAFLAAIAPAQSRLTPEQVNQRVEAMLSKLTLEQKIALIGGENNMFIRAEPSIGLPALKMSDGARGVNFLLGPGVDIYRLPLNGRNFEYFGEDPYLASRIAVGYIEGVQSQGVSCTVKHFALNNSEYDRHNENSIVDERTLHEIYLRTFEAAVREAHVGAVMDSYNLIDGTHASQNHLLNVEILKDAWGFQGVLMSDWGGTYDGVAAANNGLDLEMPFARFMNAETLLPAIRDGRVTQQTIDDKVRRILRLAVEMGWLDRPQADPGIPLYDQASRATSLQSAEEAIVLLKI